MCKSMEIPTLWNYFWSLTVEYDRCKHPQPGAIGATTGVTTSETIGVTTGVSTGDNKTTNSQFFHCLLFGSQFVAHDKLFMA